MKDGWSESLKQTPTQLLILIALVKMRPSALPSHQALFYTVSLSAILFPK